MSKNKKKKKKGSKKKKKTQKKPKLDSEELRIVLKKFVKDYQSLCTSPKYKITPFDSITKYINKLHRAESEPTTHLFSIMIREKCNLIQLKALLEILDLYTSSPKKPVSFEKTYENVSLLRSSLGNEGTQYLSVWLQKNNHLKVLELLDNDIGVKGCSMLGQALKVNETLTSLNLDHNRFGDEGAIKLADGIQWNFFITNISLQYCEIGEFGGKCIGEMIVRNCKSLEKLNLQGNPLGEKGIISIFDNIEFAKNLKTLVIADTSFGSSVVALRKVSEGLGKIQQPSSTLEFLNMDLNTIDNEGAKLLLESIKQNKLKMKIKLYPFQDLDTDIYKEILMNLQINRSGGKKKKSKKKKKKKKNADKEEIVEEEEILEDEKEKIDDDERNI